MNCAEFSDVVLELARNAELDEFTRERALAHADACPRCDAELVAARSLTSALRSLASSAANTGMPVRVEENLRGEFRRAHAPVVMRAPRANRWAIGGVAGLAAAVLLSVALLRPEIFRMRGVTSPADSTPAAGVSPQSSPTQTTALVAPSTSSPETSAAAAQDSDSEYATDYVSLPSADETTFAGDQMIVRVSLPPSALASFGLPVSSDGRDSNVLADFVLGEDGMPSAVRLVQSK